ncbi:MAG: putative porin [Fimbriimonadaceae bacterium]|nr:putative porin [Fimbriimonadaceae bacterium]
MHTSVTGLTRLLSGAALLLTCGLSWADTGTTPVQAAGGGAAAEEYVKKSDLGFQWTGDARLRLDTRDRTTGGPADPRFRVRLRAGAKGSFADGKGGWGFQLATNAADPVSRNTTLGGGDVNGTGGMLGIDLAYMTFKPHADVELRLGKMQNPFVASTAIFDGDLTPEGAAVIWSPFKGGDGDLIKKVQFKGGLYAVRELGGFTGDPYSAMAQLTADLGPVSTGLSLFYFGGLNAGVNGALPIRAGTAATMLQAANQLVGNRFLSDNMAIVTGRASYPFSIQDFPITVHGEAAYNTIENSQNFLWELGLTLPKLFSGKGALVVRDSGQFSSFSPWSDSDLGEGTGYHAGVLATWTRPVLKNVDFTASYYHYDRFQPFSGTGRRTTHRLQLDLSAKF